MKSSKHLLLLSFGILGLGLSGCGPRSQESHGKNSPIVVGMELAYRPFEMTDEQGEPAGISVDMARDLGTYLNRDIEIRNMSFDGLIPALRSGNIDLIISSMTATEERAESIDFSDPYVWTGLAMLVGADSEILTIEDVNVRNRTVAVKQGTTGHIYAQTALPRATVRVFDDESAAVLEVVQGKADVFLYDQMSIYRHAERHPEKARALLEPFRREAWAIGVRKGNEAMLEAVNDFLRDYRNLGGFAQLTETYLAEMHEAFENMGYEFIFDPPPEE